MNKTISQREARRLRKRVADLENFIMITQNSYAREYPGGIHIGMFQFDSDDHRASAVYTARRLDHAVVVVADGNKRFNLYAIKHDDPPAAK